jgi:hypothetical protein
LGVASLVIRGEDRLPRMAISEHHNPTTITFADDEA